MKSFILALSALVSVSAFAMPKIGDKFTYAVSGNSDGITSYDMTITGMDEEKENFLLEWIDTYNDGHKQEESGSVEVEDLETLDEYTANCAEYGTVETITVAAGTFETCHVSDDVEDIWVSNQVPFYVVKFHNADRGYTEELVSFSRQ